MSTCISRHGEFSEHSLDDSYICTLCGVLDEEALRAELAQARSAIQIADATTGRRTAQRDQARAELRDAHNDLLDVRGILSPNGYEPVTPLPLVPTVAPAVQWLVDQLAAVEQDRDRLSAELAKATEELEGLREVVSLHEAVVDTDAYRLAAGITCRPGQGHSCGDAHHIGRCYKPSAEPSGTEAGSATEAKKHQLPVCASCGHRHRWGGECADHSWGDSCPYDAGADCELAAEDTAGMQPCQPIGCDNGHHLAGCRFADIDGSGEVS